MALINRAGQEVSAKIVYYGPGLSGKTTNLEIMFRQVPETNRGKMISMKTRTDRTLFFDLLPINSEPIHDFQVRILLYTVPGQVYYNATRRLVLKGVDAVVFVADSQRDKLQENIESLENLRSNLTDMGLSLDDIPWVMQYNKRDLPDIMSVDELEKALNSTNVPTFEAVASRGDGVQETMRGIVEILRPSIKSQVESEIGLADRAPAAPDVETPAPAEPSLSEAMKTTIEQEMQAPQAQSAETTQPPTVEPSAEPVLDTTGVAGEGGDLVDTITPEPPVAETPDPAPEPRREPAAPDPVDMPALVMMPGQNDDLVATASEPPAAETPAAPTPEPPAAETPAAPTPEPPVAEAPAAPDPVDMPALVMMPGQNDDDFALPASETAEAPPAEEPVEAPQTAATADAPPAAEQAPPSVAERFDIGDLPEPKVVEYPGPEAEAKARPTADAPPPTSDVRAAAETPWTDDGRAPRADAEWETSAAVTRNDAGEFVLELPRKILESGELRLRIVLAADAESGKSEASAELVDQR